MSPSHKARWEPREAEDGSFYFVLVGRNGEVQLTSETYPSKQHRARGIEDAKAAAVEAST